MTHLETLSALLEEDMKNLFEMEMINLKDDIMSWGTVKEETNFGVLLHKEGLWSLYQFKEEKSLLYHLCRNQYGRMELNNNPCHPDGGECVECGKEAPEEIQGLWKLHNFEWIQQGGVKHV